VIVEPGELIARVRQELAAAVGSLDHPWRTPVLVTGGAAADGRIVVLRRFCPDPPALDCFTDLRSPKIRAIREHPQVTWVFYHPQLRLQARIRAQAEILHEDVASSSAWDELSPAHRREYASATGPGSVWRDQPGLEDVEARRYFAVIHTVPGAWDLLQLSREGHHRVQWTAKAGEERLVP